MLLWLIIPGYLGLNLYLYERFADWMHTAFPAYHHPMIQCLHILVQVFFTISPLLAWFSKKPKSKWFLSHIANMWLGVDLYGIGLLAVTDLTAYLLIHTGTWGNYAPVWWVSHPDAVEAVIGVGLGMLICLICIFGFFQAHKIHVNTYQVSCHVPDDRKDCTILLVADLHLGYNQDIRYVNKLVDKIKQQKADMICFAGDIFDNSYDALLEPERMIQKLSELEAPLGVYGCWGNHDVEEKLLAGFSVGKKKHPKRDKRMEEFVKKAGIHMLEDERLLIDNQFWLIGRKDAHKPGDGICERKTLEKLLPDSNQKLPIFVLDHQPRALEKNKKAGVSLLLSGHTHNGQLFPGNLFQKLFCKNPWGIRKMGEFTSVTTSGAGVWGPALRVGTQSEIAVVHVTFWKEGYR